MSDDEKNALSEENWKVPTFTPRKLAELIRLAIKAGLSLLVTGSPGQGKTTLFQQICKEEDVDLVIAHPVVDSAIDYKGMPALVEIIPNGKSKAKPIKEATFLPFGDLKRLIDPQKKTIHLADDLGNAANMVQCAYGQLMYNRAVNQHAVDDEVVFMAATNRKKDKTGIQGIITMLLDRFDSVVELINSLNDWSLWANTHHMPHELISWVRYRPQVLNSFEPKIDMTRTPTPRGLESVGKWINAGIPKDMQLKTFSGAIGKEWATEFVGWLRIYKDLPDPDKVLMSPKNAAIPDSPSNLYALCGALSARATENNMERLITYANRLTDEAQKGEFSLLTVNDATSRNPSLCNTKAFLDWAIHHQDILT